MFSEPTLPPGFYQNIEIRPKHKKEFNETYSGIHFPKDFKFVLHYLFLYQNEVGMLFDTYYLARYQITDVKTEEDIPDSIDFRSKIFMLNNNTPTDSSYIYFQIIDDNISTRIYSKKEEKDIFKDFKKIGKDIKDN